MNQTKYSTWICEETAQNLTPALKSLGDDGKINYFFQSAAVKSNNVLLQSTAETIQDQIA